MLCGQSEGHYPVIVGEDILLMNTTIGGTPFVGAEAGGFATNIPIYTSTLIHHG